MTFALFAYNQERYILEAIEGALAQTYEPLEIIMSDDCSTDGTYTLMQSALEQYSGPHRVVLNRNQKNLGIGNHINKVMELASGELVVVAAGDDISTPERTRRICDTWIARDRRCFSIHSAATVIDEAGTVIGRKGVADFPCAPDELTTAYLERIVEKVRYVMGATHAWSKKCFDDFGPLGSSITCEDRVIPFRSALLGGVQYIDEELVLWRSHGHNLSARDEWIAGGHPYSMKVCKWDVESVRQYLRDFDAFVDRGALPRDFNKSRLRRKIELKLAEVEMRLQLLIGRNRGEALARALRNGVPKSRILKEYMKTRFPTAFRRYLSTKKALADRWNPVFR